MALFLTMALLTQPGKLQNSISKIQHCLKSIFAVIPRPASPQVCISYLKNLFFRVELNFKELHSTPKLKALLYWLTGSHGNFKLNLTLLLLCPLTVVKVVGKFLLTTHFEAQKNFHIFDNRILTYLVCNTTKKWYIELLTTSGWKYTRHVKTCSA